jgi:hypothetical protein
MSDAIEQYRKMADKARAEAAGAMLPNVKQLHLRSADRLDEIVRGMEKVSLAKSENDEAKRCAASAAVSE